MAANEVNDIVVRLLAAADKIGGRDREEILHHVGRLSRAATRERSAAVDEMQKLRKKVVQQSADLKRLENTSQELRRLENLNQTVSAAPVAQAPQAAQPPLVGLFRNIVPSGSPLTLHNRPGAMLVSIKAVSRRWAPNLPLSLTMDLTTVACRALRACLSRCVSLQLPPMIRALPVASSSPRLLVWLPCLLLSLAIPPSKNSLDTVPSTRPASLHSKPSQMTRYHPMGPTSALHSQTGPRLRSIA